MTWSMRCRAEEREKAEDSNRFSVLSCDKGIGGGGSRNIISEVRSCVPNHVRWLLWVKGREGAWSIIADVESSLLIQDRFSLE